MTNHDSIALDKDRVDFSVLRQMPLKWLKAHCALPFAQDAECVYIAFGRGFEQAEIERAQEFFKHKFVKGVSASEHQILGLLSEFELVESFENLMRELKFELENSANSDKSAVSKLFELIIAQSIQKRASDIHIEPDEDGAMVRFRVDGILSVFLRLETSIYQALIFYAKLLAHLNVAEQRRAQDGSFSLLVNGAKYDFRLSSLPLLYGESLVLRVLEHKQDFLTLGALALDSEVLTKFKKRIHAPLGLVLLTGPTGSGKSTTLYAALNEIKSTDKKIITAEDPIEYRLPLVQQIVLNEKAGLDFNNALRTILRQDPDIIVIGEIRDEESLDIALKSSLTGHLVFSTLHTNDAVSAIARMLDMNAKAYLIASALSVVIAQRLVRRLCEHCKVKSAKKHPEFEGEFYEACGCEHCKMSGYAGREVVSEFLFVDESVAEMIRTNAKPSKILAYARENGFKTMFEVGLQKAKEGKTSIDELLRVMR